MRNFQLLNGEDKRKEDSIIPFWKLKSSMKLAIVRKRRVWQSNTKLIESISSEVVQRSQQNYESCIVGAQETPKDPTCKKVFGSVWFSSSSF